MRVLERHGRSLEGVSDASDELALEQPVLASCYAASAGDVQLLGAAPGQKTAKLVHPVRCVPSPSEPLAEVGGRAGIRIPRQLPGSFLPVEDQGRPFASIQLPSDATLERTDAVVRRYERYVASRPAFHANVAVQGFSFSGSGPNAAMMFGTLVDWEERDGATAQEEVAALNAHFRDLRDGRVPWPSHSSPGRTPR